MKAEELRIGNVVLTTKDNHLIRFISFFGLCNVEVTPDKFKPMPLTEEWLLKFGFKKDDNGYLWKDEITHYLELMPVNEDWYPVWATVPEFQSETEQRSTMNSINSVHQLQNLYYALTGTDLTIPVSEKPLCEGA